MSIEYFGRSLSIIRNYHLKIVNKVLNDYSVPLSSSEYFLLGSIQENPGMTQYRLSQISGYSEQRCSQLISSLESSGLAVVKSDDSYGRGRRILVTRAGEKILEDIPEGVNKYLAAILSDEELKIFESLDEPLHRASESLKNNKQMKRELRS
ncbi:MAG: MarR family transcriptional regulator [Spirochaetales bacterium]|nr:MarR family transcriptional regulator [Spirochaetales bacterium]